MNRKEIIDFIKNAAPPKPRGRRNPAAVVPTDSAEPTKPRPATAPLPRAKRPGGGTIPAGTGTFLPAWPS